MAVTAPEPFSARRGWLERAAQHRVAELKAAVEHLECPQLP
jgi:hypothetical protein